MGLFLTTSLPTLKAQQDREQALQALEAEQQQYFKQRFKEEQDYFSERDRAFTQLLRERWRAQPAKAPLAADPMPKRPAQPLVPGTRINSNPVIDTSWRKPPSITVVDTSKIKTKLPRLVQEPLPDTNSKSSLLFTLPFFGQSLSLIKPFETEILPNMPLTSSRIAQWWDRMAKDRKSMLQTLAFRKSAEDLKLKGWPIFQMLKTYSEQLPISTTHQRMLVWYYLNRLGYDAKLGIDGTGAAIVMASTDAEIFGLTFYQENSSGKRFYMIMRNENLPGNRFLTYRPATYDQAARPLEMFDISFELQDPHPSSIQRSFTYAGKNQTYSFQFSRHRMNLLATWPQAAFKVYAKPAPKLLPLVEEIKTKCAHLNNREKVDFLLAMVQNSLAYQTDEAQFGMQRHLFPEETLAMPYSDCEDRSFLFSTLVKMAFNFEVVLLDYPGHVATAVQLGPPNNNDDVLAWKGRPWVVCDPTYLNATSGMSMPEFQKITPEVIALQ